MPVHSCAESDVRSAHLIGDRAIEMLLTLSAFFGVGLAILKVVEGVADYF